MAYVYILLINMMARLQAVLLLVMAGCVLPAGKATNFPKPTCPDRAESLEDPRWGAARATTPPRNPRMRWKEEKD